MWDFKENEIINANFVIKAKVYCLKKQVPVHAKFALNF